MSDYPAYFLTACILALSRSDVFTEQGTGYPSCGSTMPAAGFEALFEVAALSAALTISCIVGSRYAVRCIRSGSLLNVSALVASLLTAFFSVNGELEIQSFVQSTQLRTHPHMEKIPVSHVRDIHLARAHTCL